jgi:hypothetical protein
VADTKESTWILRYRVPQSQLVTKPKVKINRSNGQPPYICISHVRVAPDGIEWPFIEVPEEIGYYVLSRSTHWQLWSPTKVTIGFQEGLRTVSKTLKSVRDEMRLAEVERIEKEAEAPILASRVADFDRMAVARQVRSANLAALKAAKNASKEQPVPAEDAGDPEE